MALISECESWRLVLGFGLGSCLGCRIAEGWESWLCLAVDLLLTSCWLAREVEIDAVRSGASCRV